MAVARVCGAFRVSFFGILRPAAAGKLLWWELPDERPRDFGGLAIVVVHKEAAAGRSFDLHSNGQCSSRNVVRFLDRLVRLQKCDAVFELHVERIAPCQKTRVSNAAKLGGAEGNFKIQQFHFRKLQAFPRGVFFWGVPIARENGFAQFCAIELFGGIVHVDLITRNARAGQNPTNIAADTAAATASRLGINFCSAVLEFCSFLLHAVVDRDALINRVFGCVLSNILRYFHAAKMGTAHRAEMS